MSDPLAQLAQLRRLAALRESRALAEVGRLAAEAAALRARHAEIAETARAARAALAADPALAATASRLETWAEAKQAEVNMALARVEAARAPAQAAAVQEVGRCDALTRIAQSERAELAHKASSDRQEAALALAIARGKA